MANKKKTIQGRMLLWILAVTGVILVAVIFWSYTSARERLELDLQEKALHLVKGTARQIDAHLGPFEGIVQGVAYVLESLDRTFTFAEVRAIQTAILNKVPGIMGMAVAFEPGMAPKDWPDYSAWEYREGGELYYEDLSGETFLHTLDDWFMLPKHLARPVWSEPYDWHGLLMVTYTVPFYATDALGNKQFIGVVTCDLSLEFLNKLLASLPLNATDYAMLISRNGTFVAHPDRSLILNESMFSLAQERKSPRMREIGQKMAAKETGLTEFASHMTKEISWLLYTPLNSAEWTMALMISRNEMRQAVYLLSRNQLLLGAIGMWFLFFAVAIIARSITRPIERLGLAADELADGNLDANLPQPERNDEVARLIRSFITMRDNLHRYMADLEETTAARERMDSELRIAHDIQMSLVPKTFPPIPSRTDLDLFAALEPAREVGGDFYDFFALDDNRLVLAIGDVSGKGVPAALFMAVTRSFLRSAFRSDSDPAIVMDHVNRELNVGNDACMFVTLFCAILNLDTGVLEYVNAGHNPPLIRYPDSKIVWITEPKGPIAGVMEEMTYESGHVSFPEGSLLVFYTDGVTEAMDVKQNLYGEDRLHAWLESIDDTTCCEALTDALLKEIKTFAGEAEQSDDITVLMVKKLSPNMVSCSNPEVRPKQEVTPLEVVSSPARLPFLVASWGFEKQIGAEWSELETLMNQAESYLEQNGIVDNRVFKVRLALEELLTNTIKYGCAHAVDPSAKPCEINVKLCLDDPILLIIEDNTGPFDPNQDAPAPNLEEDIEERTIGGLGLHMLKEMGMHIKYQRKGNLNCLQVEILGNDLDA